MRGAKSVVKGTEVNFGFFAETTTHDVDGDLICLPWNDEDGKKAFGVQLHVMAHP
jgi:hypothetical protein